MNKKREDQKEHIAAVVAAVVAAEVKAIAESGNITLMENFIESMGWQVPDWVDEDVKASYEWRVASMFQHCAASYIRIITGRVSDLASDEIQPKGK